MRRPDSPSLAALFALAFVFLASSGCETSLPTRSNGDAGTSEADASPPKPDAASTPTASAVQISPRQAYLQAEQSQQFEAQLLDQFGQPLSTVDGVVWTSSNSSVAQVSAAGLLLASEPGTVELHAQIGSLESTIRVDVFGELEACCTIATGLPVDNFCAVAANTESCPMTSAGGACDVDGDGDYDEMSDAAMQAMTSFFALACSESNVCSIEQVANVATDCSSDFDPDNRHWRCVELTTDFPGTQVSQVCQDFGSGPRWYTYNLTPLDCCACDNTNLPPDQIPAACVCVGSGCL